MLVYFCCLFSSLKIKVCIVHLHPCFDCIKLCAVLLHLSWAIFEKAFKILFDACMSLLVALTHKVDTREENSPATPAGIQTRIFFNHEPALLTTSYPCADSYSMSVPAPVTTVARKRPRSFCQRCRWQVRPKHANTLDPNTSEWADYVAVQAWCGNLSGNELTCKSAGNTQTQSSQLAEPLWTDTGLKSGISVRRLISTLKKGAGGE